MRYPLDKKPLSPRKKPSLVKFDDDGEKWGLEDENGNITIVPHTDSLEKKQSQPAPAYPQKKRRSVVRFYDGEEKWGLEDDDGNIELIDKPEGQGGRPYTSLLLNKRRRRR